MTTPRDLLNPETLMMLQTIADKGSFAAAARALNVVPSTLTYRIRQLEDALDVLLYDRSSRQAKPTEAGVELLKQSRRLLNEVDAVANRIKRIATGWEAQLTIAVDTTVHFPTVMEICSRFLAMNPPTRIRLRDEGLSGTLAALQQGQADLAIGVVADSSTVVGLQSKPLGILEFVYAVAPNHPLARAPEPLQDESIQQYRGVAVSDSVQQGAGLTFGLFAGQDVFTVSSMQAKLDAHLRGLGAGTLPLPLAQHYIDNGLLVVKRTQQGQRHAPLRYAWRQAAGEWGHGRALAWWLAQLENPLTRSALLGVRPETKSASKSAGKVGVKGVQSTTTK